jgi:hypothetical protein
MTVKIDALWDSCLAVSLPELTAAAWLGRAVKSFQPLGLARFVLRITNEIYRDVHKLVSTTMARRGCGAARAVRHRARGSAGTGASLFPPSRPLAVLFHRVPSRHTVIIDEEFCG